MLFLIHCQDKEGAQALRAGNAAAHAQYMRENTARIRLGGPLLGEDGSERKGVVVLGDFEDARQARDFMAQEPYHRAGLFERVTIHPFQVVMNAFAKE